VNEFQAAAMVGLSPRLLRWLTKYAPKQGDDRKLKAKKEVDGILFFDEEELRSFNEWLRLPWPHCMPQQVLAVMENSLLAGDVSKQTHDTISKQLQDPQISRRRLDDPARLPNLGAIAGLILGSPEFQRR